MLEVCLITKANNTLERTINCTIVQPEILSNGELQDCEGAGRDMARLAKSCVVVLTLVLFDAAVNASGDIYAAVSELEELVYLEQRLINASRNYIKDERKRLYGLKQFAEAVETASKLSLGNPEEYIANPINSYLLLKRFTWGWKELGGLLNLSDEKLKGI